MNKIILFILFILSNMTLYGQVGNTMSNPINVNIGITSPGHTISFSEQANTANFTNNYSGRSTNDVFYRVNLSKKTLLTLSHCGSTVSDTYMYLLNAAGTLVAYNDDYYGEGKCTNTSQSYIKKELDAGIYFVVSEGYSQNGIIKTTFSAQTIPVKGDTFGSAINAGTFSDNFNFTDTQNTVNYTNAFTTRSPNDVYYKFTLSEKMLVTMSHCDSKIDTYMTLLDASGKTLATNDDYSGDGACSSRYSAFIQKELAPGIYYIVSEAYSGSGIITTNISGQSSAEFGYGEIPNKYTSDKAPVVTIGSTFDISPTGAAQYSVPIEMPKGVGGLEPSLSITYNSQLQNGIAGWGFNLSGLSAITRTPKNHHYDNTYKGLTYTTGDAYMLDGKRLIQTSGNDLQEGAVYYLEDDPQTKIIAHGVYNSSTANTWFEIQHSNGLKYYYGNTTSARQSYTSGTSPRIFSWYLDYIEDAMGNYVNYSYSKYYLTLYPNSITYGKNKNSSNGITNTVTFSWEYRNDEQKYVIEGQKGYMDRRLKNITSYTDGIIYRQYDLVYNTTSDNTGTKFSRLTSITVKNKEGESLKPVTFNWTYLPTFYEYVNSITINSASTYPAISFEEQHYSSGDFNGDGLTDILGIAPVKIPTGYNSWTYDTYGYIYYASLDSYGIPQFLTGTNYQLGASFDMGSLKSVNGSHSVIDFDGDGVNEFIMPNLNVSDYWKQVVFFIYSETIRGVFASNLQRSSELPVYSTGNINGDGKGDIVFIEKGHSGNKYPGEIIGHNSGKTLYRASFNLTLPSKPERMFIADYNGDGLDDLMILYEWGYKIFWNKTGDISASTFTDNNSYSGTTFGSNKWSTVRTGDFNGDGLMDFITNDTNQNNWYLILNNGNGTFSKSTGCSIYAYDQSSTDQDDDKNECVVIDFDNDGKDDMVVHKTMYDKRKLPSFPISILLPTTYTYWMRSTGSSFEQVSLATSSKGADGLSYRFLVGDFNGDGIGDFINYGHNCYSSTDANVDPSWRFYSWGTGTYNAARGKIQSITQSNGSSINISYASMANNSFYVKGSGSTYPVIDVKAPIHAVISTSFSNGVASSINTTYQYKGLKIHTKGKGLLGMSSVVSNNNTHGIVNETGIKAWNTTFYIPSSTYSKTTIDNKTSEKNTILTIVDKGSKKYFAYPSTIIDKDLDGNMTTVTYKFNTTYGYKEEEKVDYGNNMYKTVQYGNFSLSGRKFQPQLITNIQKHSDDGTTFTNRTAITYDLNKGYQTQIIKNFGSALALTVNYTYDLYGNILTSKESGSGISPVTCINTYDSSGRFITKSYSNPASTVTSFTYDTWGNLLTEKDETISGSILTTGYEYDKWGKLISTLLPDGRKAKITRGWNNANQSKRYFVITEGTGKPWVKTWYDANDREVLVETIGEKGMRIQNTTSYDPKGQVSSKRLQTGNLISTETYTYDVRGRLVSSNNSLGHDITYSYDNRKVSMTSNGRTYTKVYDAWGCLKAANDPVSSIAYAYKSLGKPSKITTSGVDISLNYDDVGNQITLTDPNAGTSTYTYDAAGRLVTQKDGRGKITTNKYDALGRLSTSTLDGVTTTHTYGTSGYDFLQLTKVQTGNNYITYSYDKYGRIATEKRQIDGNGLFEFKYGYNPQGQLSQTIYPGNVQVNRQYDSYGNAIKVLADTQVIWELTGATGTVFTSQLGGTLTASKTHNSQGLLMNIKTEKGSTTVHNMDFVFDGKTGNLTSRTGMISQPEIFTFDNIDRLISVKHGSTNAMNIDYKPNGNINSKTGLGIYGYGTKPHAVTSVENTGKLISTNLQDITYTAFNKINSIKEKVGTDDFELNYIYGTDLQRWKTVLKKNNTVMKTTIFAGNYESIVENGQTRQLYYINGADGTVAIYVKQSGQSDKIYYPHFDHLGSIVKITDNTGTEVFKASYDAWGKQTISNNTFAFHRGYTGHEHLKEFGLINMNGRMYDPILGRFLSPDPFVQAPDFSQNYNSYSYCLNNPLKYTDENGQWFGIDDLFIAGAGFVFGYLSYGLSEGDWGWKAAGAGAMGASSSWLMFNTSGLATGQLTGATWGQVGSMALNTAVNQAVQMPAVPIGETGLSLGMSPSFGLGTNGLTVGMNVTGNYSNGNLSISAGIGAGDGYWGWRGAGTYNGIGIGFGKTSYEASEVMGQKFEDQKVGTFTGYFKNYSLSVSNDLWGDKDDRQRTSAVELTIGKWSVGTYLYTNDGRKASNKMIDESDNCIPPWPVGLKKSRKRETWTNGRPYFAPLWVGYRNGNQITRVGFSHKIVHNLTQNMVHKFMKTPYYMSYDEFKTGGYVYSGYNNPLSLWER